MLLRNNKKSKAFFFHCAICNFIFVCLDKVLLWKNLKIDLSKRNNSTMLRVWVSRRCKRSTRWERVCVPRHTKMRVEKIEHSVQSDWSIPWSSAILDGTSSVDISLFGPKLYSNIISRSEGTLESCCLNMTVQRWSWKCKRMIRRLMLAIRKRIHGRWVEERSRSRLFVCFWRSGSRLVVR